ncbi:META domain-containing protein [Ottowia flava]|uniref:META domain-containing protein n=2 Tax=Ottowia TaxID=219181 RepID=A0ABW4KZ95_9BURK
MPSALGLIARVGPAVAAVAMLAACAQPATQSTNPPPMNQPPSSSIAPAAQAADLARQLTAYEWELTGVRDARGQNDAHWRVTDRPPLRLSFKEGRVAAQNLCNVVGAGYEVNGTQLRISRGMATMRACPEPGLMALEQRVSQQLPTAESAEIRPGAGGVDAPRLTLRFADGSQWELAGAATPETRYGSAGERMFLEVAPRKVACNHPLMRNAKCLRVRDVHYNTQGVKTSTGPWRIFQGSIEGYEHRPGVRNILRVNRYSRAVNGQIPADAPSHAYVLDMVVETRTAR